MKLTETHSSQNGYHKTSPQSGEVFVAPASPQPTTFPTEAIPFSLPRLFYHLTRCTWGDVRPIRLIQWLLVLAASLWAVGWLPGRWWGVALVLILIGMLQWRLRRWRQQDFVTFVAGAPPAVNPQRIDPREKIPVHVTGCFGVENKIQRFTWLPGFYRTFATREHALICQVANRPFLWLGRWPEAEVGLWYIFFMPQMIQQIQWGALHFGAHSRPALAVTYQPATHTKQRNRDLGETVYITFASSTEGNIILTDLLADLPTTVLGPNRLDVTPPQ